MSQKVYIDLTITDTKTGKIVRKVRRRLSHSFVIGYLQLIEHHARGAYNIVGAIIAVKNTANAAKNIQRIDTSPYQKVLSMDAPVTTSTYGIVVGSSNAAPAANTDYALTTQIAHGVAAGNLQYGAHNYIGAAVVGANVDFVSSRPFINGSGNDVTARECGIYYTGNDNTAAQIYLCIIRDTFADVVVANGQTLTVTYTFRTTV